MDGSVQFSNHTGYDVCKGEVLQGEQLLTLVSVRAFGLTRVYYILPRTFSPSHFIYYYPSGTQGLEANGLLKGYTHLLTGYISSPSFLKAVVEVAHKLKVRVYVYTGRWDRRERCPLLGSSCP